MDPVDADFARATLRATIVELSVVLLAKRETDTTAAVDFLVGVLGAAFRLR